MGHSERFIVGVMPRTHSARGHSRGVIQGFTQEEVIQRLSLNASFVM